MKRRTNAELIGLLNKVTSERDTYRMQMENSQRQTQALQSQVIWHKHMNQQLMEAILAGAKEGTWPRRPQS